MKDFLEAFTSMAMLPVLISQAAVNQFAQILCAQKKRTDTLEQQLVAGLAGELPAHAEPTQATDADLYVGKSLAKTKRVTDLHTLMFGLVSLDFNPLHFHEDVAQRSRFRGRITHGMHTASLFSGVLSELTPWCAYLHQSVDFLAPVHPDELVTATGVIEEIDDRGVVHVGLICCNEEGKVVARGHATVKKLKEMYQPSIDTTSAEPVPSHS